MPRRPRISRLTRASPLISATRPIRNTTTAMPRCCSVRATTKPSPPLFPRPQRSATRMPARSSKLASIAATTCRPAFSISTSDGMPMSSIVRRSASRICAESSTRIGDLDTGRWSRWAWRRHAARREPAAPALAASLAQEVRSIRPREIEARTDVRRVREGPWGHVHRRLRQRHDQRREARRRVGPRSRVPLRRGHLRNAPHVPRKAVSLGPPRGRLRSRHR